MLRIVVGSTPPPPPWKKARSAPGVWVWVMMDPPCVHVHGHGRHDTAMSSAVILIVGDVYAVARYA